MAPALTPAPAPATQAAQQQTEAQLAATLASWPPRPASFVNECAKVHSFESLYRPDGSKNTGHYYWRVQWVNTPAGFLALTLEDGSGKLYLTDLRTGRKVVVLERGLGISDWSILHREDGTVGVKERLGFEWQEVADVAALLQAPAEVASQETAKPAAPEAQ